MRTADLPSGALCARPGTDPELWFPDDTAPDYPARVAAARRVCLGCPVRAACLADRMRWEPAGSRFGIVAATTPQERDELAQAGTSSVGTGRAA
jgi:WhiB family redox-sensing transcriptional regulator